MRFHRDNNSMIFPEKSVAKHFAFLTVSVKFVTKMFWLYSQLKENKTVFLGLSLICSHNVCASEQVYSCYCIAFLFFELHITAGLFGYALTITLELLQIQLSSISCTNSSGRKTCFCGPDTQLLLDI